MSDHTDGEKSQGGGVGGKEGRERKGGKEKHSPHAPTYSHSLALSPSLSPPFPPFLTVPEGGDLAGLTPCRELGMPPSRLAVALDG